MMQALLKPSPEQEIIGCALSNFLADRRPQIVSQWLIRVRRDPAVPAADVLTLGELKDHIPQLLDDLNRTLYDAFSEEIKESAAWRAATHAQIRWEQRYDVSQLIRELGDLRIVLIHHLAEFQDERAPDFSGKLGLFAMVVFHSFFDKVIENAVGQFIAKASPENTSN